MVKELESLREENLNKNFIIKTLLENFCKNTNCS